MSEYFQMLKKTNMGRGVNSKTWNSTVMSKKIFVQNLDQNDVTNVPNWSQEMDEQRTMQTIK